MKTLCQNLRSLAVVVTTWVFVIGLGASVSACSSHTNAGTGTRTDNGSGSMSGCKTVCGCCRPAKRDSAVRAGQGSREILVQEVAPEVAPWWRLSRFPGCNEARVPSPGSCCCNPAEPRTSRSGNVARISNPRVERHLETASLLSPSRLLRPPLRSYGDRPLRFREDRPVYEQTSRLLF